MRSARKVMSSRFPIGVPTTYSAGADCELLEPDAIEAECNTDAHVLLDCKPHAGAAVLMPLAQKSH
jgi:hypothetical protein